MGLAGQSNFSSELIISMVRCSKSNMSEDGDLASSVQENDEAKSESSESVSDGWESWESGSSSDSSISEDGDLTSPTVQELDKVEESPELENGYTKGIKILEDHKLDNRMESPRDLPKEILSNKQDILQKKLESLKQATSESDSNTISQISPRRPVHLEKDVISQNDVSSQFYNQFLDLAHNLLSYLINNMSASQISFLISVLFGTQILKYTKSKYQKYNSTESARHSENSESKNNPLGNKDYYPYKFPTCKKYPNFTVIAEHLRNITVMPLRETGYRIPDRNGARQYLLDLQPRQDTLTSPRQTRGIGQNFGLLGSTINTYDALRDINPDFIRTVLFNIHHTLGTGVGMLSNYTDLWYHLRCGYNSDFYVNYVPPTLTIPSISHVGRRDAINLPNNTGIIVHIISGNRIYNQLNVADFDLARRNIIRLLTTRGNALMLTQASWLNTNLQNYSNPDQILTMYSNDIVRLTHEFLAILHHYQIHFSNRNGPRDH